VEDARRVLGVHADRGHRDAIEGAFRRASFTCHPDRAPAGLTHAEVVEQKRRWKALCDAKSLLLNEAAQVAQQGLSPVSAEGSGGCAARALARQDDSGKGRGKGTQLRASAAAEAETTSSTLAAARSAADEAVSAIAEVSAAQARDAAALLHQLYLDAEGAGPAAGERAAAVRDSAVCLRAIARLSTDRQRGAAVTAAA